MAHYTSYALNSQLQDVRLIVGGQRNKTRLLNTARAVYFLLHLSSYDHRQYGVTPVAQEPPTKHGVQDTTIAWTIPDDWTLNEKLWVQKTVKRVGEGYFFYAMYATLMHYRTLYTRITQERTRLYDLEARSMPDETATFTPHPTTRSFVKGNLYHDTDE